MACCYLVSHSADSELPRIISH